MCVTDGVPLNGIDAQAHGFAGLDAYRIARRQELFAAFKLAGLDGMVCSKELVLRDERGAIADQTAAFRLIDLIAALCSEIREYRPEVILTHPYEGGHPDHDACAFATHTAVRLLEKDVSLVEAPFYHAGPDGIESGTFLPGDATVSVDELSSSQQERKRKRLACFASQRETLGLFGTEREQYRLAPVYDFTRRPHNGRLYYEGFPWGMTGDRFCELAKVAQKKLGLRAAV